MFSVILVSLPILIVGKLHVKKPSKDRSFLGMTQYVTTRQDPSWTWSKTQQPAFVDLKDALSASHVMVYFDQNTLIEVIVDTFLVGVSAMLTREGKFLAYASTALTGVESRYSQESKADTPKQTVKC